MKSNIKLNRTIRINLGIKLGSLFAVTAISLTSNLVLGLEVFAEPVTNFATNDSDKAQTPSESQQNWQKVRQEMDSNKQLIQTAQSNVTSVSQLSDVRTTDWAFTALQSLVERYGCIAGYPDKTYRGQRAMTRFEFSAGLNACLDKVNELISAGLTDKVSKEDLAALQRLQEEFATELASLKGRVDNLDAKVTKLEAQQFSVTTKLTGEAAFFVTSIFNNPNRPDSVIDRKGAFEEAGGPVGQNTTFSQRVRLNFNTSFSGADSLLIRLQASNIQRPLALNNPSSPDLPLAFINNVGRLQGEPVTTSPSNIFNNSSFGLDYAGYTFPIGSQATVKVIATGGKLDDFAPSLNALDYGGAALGSISEFGQRNAIYRMSGQLTAGFGLDYRFSDSVQLSLGYLGGNNVSSSSSASSPSAGLFGGTYGAIAQLTFRPTKGLDLGFSYVRSLFSAQDVFLGSPGLDGGVGSHFAEIPLGGGINEVNSYGFQGSYRITPGFTLGGWVGVSDVTSPNGGFNPFGQQVAPPGGKATIVNWAVTLAFPDLFKQGSLAGIVFGQAPKTTFSDGRLPPQFAKPGVTEANNRLIDGDPSYHIEGFYRYPLSKNISITPGVVVITNPEYDARNKTIVLGTVRVTFVF
jgi:Carbohydrate-selective porin, OprB family/S-layer homology domain